MRQKVGIFIIIIGIAIILYPIIANIIGFFNQTRAIVEYQDSVSNMSAEELEAKKNELKQYNDELTEESITVDDDREVGVSYLNVLDVGEIIGYISIPIIDVYLPIYHGTSEEVLESGVGHLEDSSFPIGEVGTHAVFAGHTGLVRTKMLDDIDKLEIRR